MLGSDYAADDIECELQKQQQSPACRRQNSAVGKRVKKLKSAQKVLAEDSAQQQGPAAEDEEPEELEESGFDLHPMCGFEWLMSLAELPEQTQGKKTKIVAVKAASQTRTNPRNKEAELREPDEDLPHANKSDCDGTLYFESEHESDYDQNLPKERINDILQDINRDLVRAQNLQQRKAKKAQPASDGVFVDAEQELDS